MSAFDRVRIVNVWIAPKFGTFERDRACCRASADAAVGPVIADAPTVAHSEKTTPAAMPAYKAFIDLPSDERTGCAVAEPQTGHRARTTYEELIGRFTNDVSKITRKPPGLSAPLILRSNSGEAIDSTLLSFARLRPLSKKDRQSPNVPPEIVVEILSPDDRPKDVEAKRKEYLTWGVSLVLIADPDARYVDVFDSAGTYERIDASVESYSPAIIPDLVLPLRAMFAKLDLDIPDTELMP